MLSNRRTVRIEWGDCDPAGIVYYPRYFAMFDHSTVLLVERALGMRKHQLYTAYDFDGWAVVEWECALKHPEDGAREGAEFVKHHIIRVTEKAFDDFAAGGTDDAANRRMLGL